MDAPLILRPLERPLGVLPQFTQHQQQITLRLREKKLSATGDDFEVTDAVTNALVFRVDAKMFSLREARTFQDAYGKDLLVLKKKALAFHPTFRGFAPNSDTQLFEVKNKFSCLETKMLCTFNNLAGGGEPVELVLKGDFMHRRAKITTSDGTILGEIHRDFFNAGEMLMDQQTYYLTVAPGADALLLAAMAICLDEIVADS